MARCVAFRVAEVGIWGLSGGVTDVGVSKNRATSFWGPYHRDPTIWGTILGSPIFGNSHFSNRFNFQFA